MKSRSQQMAITCFSYRGQPKPQAGVKQPVPVGSGLTLIVLCVAGELISVTFFPVLRITLQKKSNLKKGGYIYILTNKNNTVLYTGVTSSLSTRIWEHRSGYHKNAFTSRYNVTKLVYYEEFTLIEDAIAREKQLKGGSRKKKVNLIKSLNPEWRDLYESVGHL